MKNIIITAALVFAASFAFAAPVSAEDAKAPVAVKYEAVKPEELNALRFPEAGWSEEMLVFIKRGPKYLAPDLDVEVPPYPENNSEETKKEIEILLGFQNKERLEQDTYARILYENRTDLWDVFEKEGMFPVAASPEGRNLVRDALLEASYYIINEKLKYQRPRPIQLSPDLTLAIDGPPHSAYPSGHSGQSHIIALTLGIFEPARLEEFKKFAHEIGVRREIAGVHYPSDGDSARHLADGVFENLMKNPEFLARVEKVKAELAAAKTTTQQ